ncbi:MAG: zinc-ribbon domain-containing protein [Betaproteobacteria bacterium]|nr:zinc-ribbon domain-containing protein [Betaproteobacteria bacterium]
MLTRCPDCQTVFRLTSEQLLARQGRVRCGNCLHPFNALDHLAESDPKVGQTSSPPRQHQSAKTPETSSAAAKPIAKPSSGASATGMESDTPSVKQSLTPKIPLETKPVLAPVIKKTSQRSLSELDFSSSIDTQSRVHIPLQQRISAQNPSPLDQSPKPPTPVEASVASPVKTAAASSPSPEIPPPAPAASPPSLPETSTLIPPLSPEIPPPAPAASSPPLSEELPPFTEASLPPQDMALPQVTRNRSSQERKRDKPRESSRQRKRVKPADKPNRLAFTFLSIGKALKESTGWSRRKRGAVARGPNKEIDKEVLNEVFSKFGIETKIDQIEAEFNAEAKVARAAARDKIETTATNVTISNTPEKPPPSHFDIAYGNLATHIKYHKYWTAAVCALGVLFVTQSVFLFRDRIARTFPNTRPAFVSICNIFGCAMPLPRDASRIKVTYGFNQRNEHRYVFYATVTNEANFEQDWPNLELTLHNPIEQPLSRRIFTPTDWVPPERLAQNTGIAPKSYVSTHLELEVTDIVPSKSDLKHFFP